MHPANPHGEPAQVPNNTAEPASKRSRGSKLPIWQYFERGTSQIPRTNFWEAFCNACKVNIPAPKPIRGEKIHMESHSYKCDYIDKSIKDVYRKEQNMRVDPQCSTPWNDPPAPEISNLSRSCASKKQTSADSFCDRSLSKEQVPEFEELLADMFVSANYSFSSIEDERFVRFWKFMRPAVKPPSRFVLSTRIIPNRIKAIENEASRSLAGLKNVTLTIDGYKNSRHEKVLGIMAVVKTERDVQNYFISTENISSQTSRAEDVIEKIEAGFAVLSQKYQAVARSVTCDSDAAHIKARRLMAEKYPDKIFLPCSAHQVNLIIRDIVNFIPAFASVSRQAIDVVSVLAQQTRALAVLREEQLKYSGTTTAINKPTDTRWYSYNNMFRSILKSQLPLQGVVARLTDLKAKTDPMKKLRNVTSDANFWTTLKQVVEVLDPVTVAQGITETDQCTLAQVTAEFASIYRTFVSLDDQGISGVLFSALEKRWQKFYDPSLFVLSLVLDPKKKMLPFKTTGNFNFGVVIRWAKAWFTRLFKLDGSAVVNSLMDYLEGSGIFGDDVAGSFTATERYWRYVRYEHKDLADLALELYYVAAHAAALERGWSQMAFVHDDNRASLKLDLATGMVQMRMKFNQEDRLARQREQEKRQKTSSIALNVDIQKDRPVRTVTLGDDGTTEMETVSFPAEQSISEGISLVSQFDTVLNTLLELEESSEDELLESMSDFYSLKDLFG